jgi:hypothetical protein
VVSNRRNWQAIEEKIFQVRLLCTALALLTIAGSYLWHGRSCVNLLVCTISYLGGVSCWSVNIHAVSILLKCSHVAHTSLQELYAIAWDYEHNKSLTGETSMSGGLQAVRLHVRNLA